MKILRWVNKYSGETGYVKSVLKSKGYFVNVWEREGAKTYMNETMALKDIELLKMMGEAENNVFYVEDK